MQMPKSWTESLLKKMTALYGERFLNQWRNVDPDDMIDAWSEALGPFCDIGEDQGKRIKWALDQLAANNPHPPTLPEFIALCRQAPRPQLKQLPQPEVSEEQASENLRKIDRMARNMASDRMDMIGWAKVPPQKSLRGPWERLICTCVEKGDTRFDGILRGHYESGVLTSDRTKRALGIDAETNESRNT